MLRIKCFSWFCHLTTSPQAICSINYTSFLIHDRCLGKNRHNLCQTSIAYPDFTAIQDIMLSIWRKNCSWPVNTSTKQYRTSSINQKGQMNRPPQKKPGWPSKDNIKIYFTTKLFSCKQIHLFENSGKFNGSMTGENILTTWININYPPEHAALNHWKWKIKK